MADFKEGQPEAPSQQAATLRDEASRTVVNRLTYAPGYIWDRNQQKQYSGDTTAYQSRLEVERRVNTCGVCARAVTDPSPHGHQPIVIYCTSCGGYHKDCLEKVGFEVGIPELGVQNNCNLCTLCYMKSSAKEIFPRFQKSYLEQRASFF